MSDDQLDAMVGLFSGLQVSLIHLANTISQATGISREELAISFSSTADLLPNETCSRELIALVLRQISDGITRTSTYAGAEAEIRKCLY